MKFIAYTLCLLAFSLLLSSCENDAEGTGDLQLNFKMHYDGQPLTLNEEFMYPAGMLMRISRFNMLISDLTLGNTRILDRNFLDIGSAHQNESGAELGLSMVLEDIKVGSYDKLSFHVGVDEALNNTPPDDLDSGDPLGLARYWAGWESYIFCSIEGQFDGERDGSLNDDASTIALHMGGNPLYSEISKDYDISIASDATTEIDVIVDLRDVFLHDGLYNIDSIPTTHTLDKINSAREVLEGISATLRLD